jgi:hypothetical protein
VKPRWHSDPEKAVNSSHGRRMIMIPTTTGGVQAQTCYYNLFTNEKSYYREYFMDIDLQDTSEPGG